MVFYIYPIKVKILKSNSTVMCIVSIYLHVQMLASVLDMAHRGSIAFLLLITTESSAIDSSPVVQSPNICTLLRRDSTCITSHCKAAIQGFNVFCGSLSQPSFSESGMEKALVSPPYLPTRGTLIGNTSVMPCDTGPMQVSHSRITNGAFSRLSLLKSPEKLDRY